MRAAHLSPNRPEYYDRNPELVGENWEDTNIAPHAPAQRFTYTVPTGRKLLLSYAYGRIFRGVAPTTPAIAKLYIGVYQPGMGTKDVFWVEYYGSNVGDMVINDATLNLVIPSGWSIYGYSMDGSTDGKCAYRLHFAGVTFDA